MPSTSRGSRDWPGDGTPRANVLRRLLFQSGPKSRGSRSKRHQWDGVRDRAGGPPSSHRRAGHGPQELQPSQGHREEALRRDWELAGCGVPAFVCWTTVAVSFEQGGSGRWGSLGMSEPSAWGGDTGIQLPPAPTWGAQADAGPSSRKPQTLWLLTILATWGALVSSLPHFPGWSFFPSAPHTEYLLSSFIGPKISLAGKEWDPSAHVPWSGCPLEHERQGPHCSSRQLEKVHGRE